MIIPNDYCQQVTSVDQAITPELATLHQTIAKLGFQPHQRISAQPGHL